MTLLRHTFIVQVREPDRLPTVENLRTHERVQLSSLSEVAVQIEKWLGTEAVEVALVETAADGVQEPDAEGANVVGLPLPVSPNGGGPAEAEAAADGSQPRRFSRPSGAD